MHLQDCQEARHINTTIAGGPHSLELLVLREPHKDETWWNNSRNQDCQAAWGKKPLVSGRLPPWKMSSWSDARDGDTFLREFLFLHQWRGNSSEMLSACVDFLRVLLWYALPPGSHVSFWINILVLNFLHYILCLGLSCRFFKHVKSK